MNEEQLINLVIEKLIEEAVTLAGGSIRGMQLPLGATPDGGPIKYANDTDIMIKPKAKKTKKGKRLVNKDPQYYLKNGSETSRKRSFK
jgi:hypothetical protein